MNASELVERLRIGSPPPDHPDWEKTWVQNLRAHFQEGMFSKRVFPEWNEIFASNVEALLIAADEAASHIEAQEKLLQDMIINVGDYLQKLGTMQAAMKDGLNVQGAMSEFI